MIVIGTGGVANIHYYNGKLATTTDCFNFTITNNISHKFIFYCLLSKLDIIDDLFFYGQGLRHLNKSLLLSYYLPIPSCTLQDKITNFLDQKTSEIDQAIVKKEKLINLLKEQKDIIIQKAVTQGLDPDVKMKDSKVDWIGEIPEHWKINRNAALYQISKDDGIEGLPILSVSIHSGVSKEELTEEENVRSAVKIQNKESYLRVKPGYIAYNMMRAWQGGIGHVEVDGMVSPAYIVLRPIGNINSLYFEYLYRTDIFIQQMNRFSKGITDFRKRLYWDSFKNLITLVPPIEDQKNIITFIKEVESKTAEIVNNTKNEIEKLKEFKQVLIANAVTGKIKI